MRALLWTALFFLDGEEGSRRGGCLALAVVLGLGAIVVIDRGCW